MNRVASLTFLKIKMLLNDGYLLFIKIFSENFYAYVWNQGGQSNPNFLYSTRLLWSPLYSLLNECLWQSEGAPLWIMLHYGLKRVLGTIHNASLWKQHVILSFSSSFWKKLVTVTPQLDSKFYLFISSKSQKLTILVDLLQL